MIGLLEVMKANEDKVWKYKSKSGNIKDRDLVFLVKKKERKELENDSLQKLP